MQAGARVRSTIARGVGVLTPVEGDKLERACLLFVKAMCWACRHLSGKKEDFDSLCLIWKVSELLKGHFFCQHALQYQQWNLFLSQNYQMNEKRSSNIFDKAKKRKRYPAS